MAIANVSSSLQSRPFVKLGFSNQPSIRQGAKHAGLARASYLGPETALRRLGLNQGASEQDVKKAYRKLALQFHPDVCKGDSSASTFMQINDAYETIMDCLQGNADALAAEPFEPEPMMGVNDDTWEDWEEWMGWEGAGTRDYSSHINHSL